MNSRQSVPARRPEDHHVPHAGGPELAGARLDHRARRQPRQLLGVRQGLQRAAQARADQEGSRAWRSSTPTAPTRSTTCTNEQACAGTAAGTTARKINAVYAAMDEATTMPHTVASAIEISRPVNLPKALRALDVMNGVVREVTDEDILEHKALVGRYGFGCEPASAASVAGLRQLFAKAHLARRACRLHPHRPRTQRPRCHGQVSHRHRHESRYPPAAGPPPAAAPTPRRKSPTILKTSAPPWANRCLISPCSSRASQAVVERRER